MVTEEQPSRSGASNSAPHRGAVDDRPVTLLQLIAGLIAAFILSVVAAVVFTEGVQTTDAEGGALVVQDPRAAPVLSRDPHDVGTPVGDRAAGEVTLELETVELEGQLADGTVYEFWTFGGTVPGPMLRIRVGDTVNVNLANAADSTQIHSIDLHAVNGPGGGAGATQVAPGGEESFRFTALNPGVYVYHCATPHVPTHIANGMYGLIVVEPEGGLAPVDREFYVMQGEVYTAEEFGAPGTATYDSVALRNEDPTYVLFNGSVGTLTGDGALQAEVGERLRIFVGNGGPDLISSFHVIGEIFDIVHDEGSSAPKPDVQTTLVPAGGATWVEFTVDVPGDYLLVDHAISRVFDKGALAVLHVTGPADARVFDAGDPAPAPEAPGGTPTPFTGGAGASRVIMSEFAFTPSDVVLPAGRHTITVTNDGQVPHEFAVSEDGTPQDLLAATPVLEPGQSFDLVIDLRPGAYEIACNIPGHAEAGMVGELTVTDS